MKYITLIAFSSILLLGASTKEKKETPFITQTEEAHQKKVFLEKSAIQFDIHVQFGGKTSLKGKMTLSTDSKQGRIELNEGQSIYYQEDKVYYSPTIEMNSDWVRFHAYTWSYFLLLPYKLQDPGTIWSTYENNVLNGKAYEANKLTFTSITGDTPDDWYIIYTDRERKLLTAAAYIVTSGPPTEEAEKDPHAISYIHYEMIENVPIAQDWLFYEWSTTDGLGKQIGETALRGVCRS